jgi:hypothetical protein
MMASPTIVISTVNLSDVRSSKNYCNVTNPAIDKSSDEFNVRANVYNYTNYMDKLPQKHFIYELTNEELDVIKDALEISMRTLKVSNLHKDDLKEIAHRLNKWMQNTFPPTTISIQKLFCRLNECSFKDSPYGIGPLFDGFDVIKRLSTSEKCCFPIAKLRSKMLIFKKWNDNIDIAGEFRCFFYNGRLTAISQYNPYDDYGWRHRSDKLHILVNEVIRLYEQMGRPFANCTMDVHISGCNCHCGACCDGEFCANNFVSVIEFNSFGWDMCAGSACFHWVRDHVILCSDGSTVNVRVVVDK